MSWLAGWPRSEISRNACNTKRICLFDLFESWLSLAALLKQKCYSAEHSRQAKLIGENKWSDIAETHPFTISLCFLFQYNSKYPLKYRISYRIVKTILDTAHLNHVALNLSVLSGSLPSVLSGKKSLIEKLKENKCNLKLSLLHYFSKLVYIQVKIS